jgi:serine/threonine protein kinase
LDALEYLHAQDSPVLHRDIKPANIKLMPNGTIKLVDFGLVKLLAPDEERTVTVLQGRGTAQYTPLEQYGGDTGHTDVRSDVYSFGATLYHLLTNQAPIDAKTRFLEPHTFQTPRQLNPMLSLRVERAILHAIEMHPDDRQSSIAELRTELFSPLPLSRVISDRTVVDASHRWAEGLRENRWLFVAAGMLGALAIVATILSPDLPALP